MVEGKWRKWKEIEVEEIGREEVERNSRIRKEIADTEELGKEKENGNKKVEHEERKSKEKRMEEKGKIEIEK